MSHCGKKSQFILEDVLKMNNQEYQQRLDELFEKKFICEHKANFTHTNICAFMFVYIIEISDSWNFFFTPPFVIYT